MLQGIDDRGFHRGLQADAIRKDMAHVRIRDQDLPQRADALVGGQEPFAPGPSPLSAKQNADGAAQERAALTCSTAAS